MGHLRSRTRGEGGYGQGVVELDADAFLPGQDVVSALRALFGAPDYRPPLLPAVALEIQRLVQRPQTGIPEILAVLEGDALLAADVLRVAQTPAYATRIPPRSLADAASRLGLRGIRDLVFQVAVTGRVFRAEGYEEVMASARRHSVSVATLTRVVASHTAVAMDYGFLFGLLHDVGLVAMLVALGDRRGPPPPLDEISSELEGFHEEAGAVVARLWNLPDELQWCIGSHRDPNLGGHDHPLIACGCVAHRLAEERGLGLTLDGHRGFDELSDGAWLRSLRALDLSERAVEALREEAGRALAATGGAVTAAAGGRRRA